MNPTTTLPHNSRGRVQPPHFVGERRSRFQPENIPQELRDIRQWVVWQLRDVRGRKPQKVPMAPAGDGFLPANCNAESSWMTFEDAARLVPLFPDQLDGVGLCPKGVWVGGEKLAILDFDGVIDEHSNIDPRIEKILVDNGLYGERSPSGRGVRSYVFLPAEHPAVKRGGSFCKLRDPSSGASVGELFVNGGFTTVTGDVIHARQNEAPPHWIGSEDWVADTAPQLAAAVVEGDIPWDDFLDPLDPATLSGTLLGVFGGDADVDRSKYMLPVLATLSWQCTTVEELCARAWQSGHLQQYFVDHRSGRGEQHQREFCKNECAKAWGMRDTFRPASEQFEMRQEVLPAGIDDWDEPLDIFAEPELDPPAFDSQHWPLVVGCAALEVGKRKSCDPLIPAAAGLAALASLITDRFRLKLKKHDDWYEPARLWLMVVGEPGRKKSPGSAAMFAPLEDIQKGIDRDYAQREETAKALDMPFEEHRLRLILSDVTTEALVERVAQYQPGGLFLQFDEGSEFFGGMDAYRASGTKKDRGFYLKGWTGQRYERVRVGTGDTVVENLSVKIYANVQPDVLRKLLGGSAEDGLIPRFIPIVPGAGTAVVDSPVSSEAYELYLKVMRMIFQHYSYASDHVVVDMTDEARNRLLKMIGWAEKMASMKLLYGKRMRLWLDKAGAHLGRLVLAAHVIDDVTAAMYCGGSYSPRYSVGLATVEKVCRLFTECLLPMVQAFYAQLSDASDPEDARKVAASLLTDKIRGKAMVTARDIHRENRWIEAGDKKLIHDLMERLSFAGWVRPFRRKNQVHPHVFEQWEVNPKIHARFEERARLEVKRRREAHEKIKTELGKRS